MPRWSPFDAAADRRLVHGLHEGDERALGDLYDAYAERVYDYARSLTGDDRAAADVVHDTFVDACRRAPRLRGRVGLGAWLYGAARRRCLQRVRGGEPTIGETALGDADGAPAVLADLTPADRELVLLADRHGLGPADAAAVTGLGVRRVRTRTDRARLRLDAAEEPEPEDAGSTVAVAAARTPDAGLAAPPPVLPAALRHRVMHTATDPELAGYRADIAARGGVLTPAGMPTQPDQTSPFTRRWLFAGGGMAGVLVTAVVAVLLIGPGGMGTTLYWPPGRDRHAPPTSAGPSGGTSGGGRTAPAPGQGDPRALPGPSSSSNVPGRTAPPASRPGTRPSSPGGSSPSPRVGTLSVEESTVKLYGTKVGRITLHAAGGPVTWRGVASSDQVTLSPAAGTLAPGGTGALTVTLKAGLLNLPGRATVTFADENGALHQVAVEWGASLL
ncbi:RNA polymerase sigma factor [Actinomadura atramentaria]|uniref:RNA polymerase sigma factor n=1 Tax=Actinomadura atramentaria TaxID=1990 RepID=UPI00036082B1|nr:RNA polymerase sigma factor [Actinomadura atramentaria]